MTFQQVPTGSRWVRVAVAISIALHVVLYVVGRLTVPHGGVKAPVEVIDVTLAPDKIEAEALDEEHAGGSAEGGGGSDEGSAVEVPAKGSAGSAEKVAQVDQAGSADSRVPVAMDAGVVDAEPLAADAAKLAVVDAMPPDAAQLAVVDAMPPDAAQLAVADAAPLVPPDAATAVAVADAGLEPPPADAAVVAIADASLEPPPDAAAAVALADAGLESPGSDASTAVAIADAGIEPPATTDDAAVAVTAPGDAGAVAMTTPSVDPRDHPPREDSGSGSGTGTGSGSGSGTGAGVGTGSGSGSGSGAGHDAENDVGVDGAKATAGTNANLTTYMPTGHMVTVLIRFDRIRKTEWADAAEKILKPLPDYATLFDPSKPAKLGDKLDLLVISSPRPKDVIATTVVAKTNLSRHDLRDLLTFKTSEGQSVTWSTAKAGLVGKRKHTYEKDKRVIVSPFKGWFVLGQPADMPSLTATTGGDLDTVEATVKLPAWLDGVRNIEKESGDKTGPSLVVTLQPATKRYTLPDYGLGITELPGPERISVAMELVKQGWLVRGNIKMRSEADAKELVEAVDKVRQRVNDSTILKRALDHMNVLNAINNLTMKTNGDRVSYATTLSIADTRVLLALAGQQLDAYFKALASQAKSP